MVARHGDTDFSKLVNLCPVKKFSLISIPQLSFGVVFVGVSKGRGSFGGYSAWGVANA